jgi:hypothetical protein
VFESKEEAERAVIAVEKEIHDDVHIEHTEAVLHVAEKQDVKSAA